MSLINQGGNQPEVFCIKHKISGIQYVSAMQLPSYLATGWKVINTPTYRYHQIHPPEIFDASEVDELAKKGWVDSPAKLQPTIIEDITPAGIDWEDPSIILIENEAKALLSGDGLNQAALMRQLDMDPTKTKQRNDIKPVYQAILAKYVSHIARKINDYFWIVGDPNVAGNEG